MGWNKGVVSKEIGHMEELVYIKRQEVDSHLKHLVLYIIYYVSFTHPNLVRLRLEQIQRDFL